MKTFKDFLLEKGISEADFAKKTVSEMADLQNEYQTARLKEIKEDIEKAASKLEVTALATKINAFLNGDSEISTQTFKDVQEALKAQGQEIVVMKETINATQEDELLSISQQVRKHFKENKEVFEELKNVKGSKAQLTIKAPATMLTSSHLTPAGNRIARTETQAGRVGFVRRNPFILEIVSVSPTKAKVVYWVEMVNEDGVVAMTVEGAVKSQIDWDYVEASERVKKITAYTKVSKEMLDDVDEFAQDIQNELTERIQLFADTAFLTGDGTGENITGIDTNATAFAAGSLASTVEAAQKLDCLRAGVAQVYRSNFTPNYIIINPDDAASMDLIKDLNNNYVLAPFVSASGLSVSGIPVITNNGVAADDFYVGDFSKYKAKIREDIDIQIGYDADDWTKNLITPLAEMRAVGYIPANHYGAIVKGTFTVAAAALETP